MNIEIKHRFTNNVLFACEAENMRDVVLNAVKNGANLLGANLRGADLYGANLRGADLRGANLYGEKLAIAPISILNLNWEILISEQYLKIGCQRHTHEQWINFSDEEIISMESRASSFWNANKIWILAACEAHKTESLAYRAANPEQFAA